MDVVGDSEWHRMNGERGYQEEWEKEKKEKDEDEEEQIGTSIYRKSFKW